LKNNNNECVQGSTSEDKTLVDGHF